MSSDQPFQPATQPADQPSTQPPPSPAPALVVMGVSGSGKSTVGAAIAQRLRVPFADADDFHPGQHREDDLRPGA